MTTRMRLTYTDNDGTGQTIGELGSGVGGLQEAILKNSGLEFTKLILVGDSSLFGSIPTDPSEFDTSEPEIFVEVYDAANDQWVTRDRVYAESQGNVKDSGRWKHKRMYGFQKYTGKQKVDTTGNPITTDIEDALNEVLPSGYVAVVPAGVTVPSVNRYTYKGNRSAAYRELTRNYGWVMWFSHETDGNGDYKVFFQPEGHGSQVDTLEKTQDAVYFNAWTKGDELRKITDVDVIGVNQSGNKVVGSATSSENGRYLRKHVGYVQDTTEADNIASNLQDTEKDEHGRVTAPITRPDLFNNLNASIQVINADFSVDDLFTVIEQKDVFHESKRVYSFEFEKELKDRERQVERDVRSERAQTVETADNNHNHPNDNPSQNDHDHGNSNPSQTNHPHGNSNPSQLDHDHTLPDTTSDAENNVTVDSDSDSRFFSIGTDVTIDGGWTQVFSAGGVSTDALFHMVKWDFDFRDAVSGVGIEFVVLQNDTVVAHLAYDSMNHEEPSGIPGVSDDSSIQDRVIVLPTETAYGSGDYEVWMSSKDNNSYDVEGLFEVLALTHDHELNFATSGVSTNGNTANLGSHPDADGNTASLNTHPDTDNTNVTSGEQDTEER